LRDHPDIAATIVACTAGAWRRLATSKDWLQAIQDHPRQPMIYLGFMTAEEATIANRKSGLSAEAAFTFLARVDYAMSSSGLRQSGSAPGLVAVPHGK